MPQLVSKIIQYRVLLNNTAFSKGVFNLDEPVYYQYAVGEILPHLRHKDSKFNPYETDAVRFPLFNKSNNAKISEQIGQYGLLHIQLEPNQYLKEIYVEPDGVTVDILVGSNELMVYEFYNPTKADTVTIRATLGIDKEGIAKKIKAHSDDLEYRQYFLKESLRKPGVGRLQKPKVEYPDLMTAEQVAEYLQISPKTVRNKTSSGEIKSHLIGGVRRYKKEELDA